MENENDFARSDMPRVLLIDDDFFIHDLVNEALAETCSLISVETGEDALMATNMWKPDLILVDVEMPGMGGYETCRQFKQREDTSQVPVLFLSGHDQIEDRLKGYEAGGDDYLTKPFDLAELKTKILHLLAMNSSRSELRSMADYASSAAMAAMTSMSEMGALLESLKHFNACDDWESLAQVMIEGVAVFDLQCVVQIRTLRGKFSLSNHGPATPLEESVIQNMTGMERIVHFKSRLSITYEYVSLLVSNMPEHDEERCGRLRDHLAMLVEAADIRIRGIQANLESQQRGLAIERSVARISEALRDVDIEQRKSRLNARLAVDALLDDVDRALIGIALSESQEDFLANTIRKGVEKILNTQSDEIDLQNHLSEIIKELNNALSG